MISHELTARILCPPKTLLQSADVSASPPSHKQTHLSIITLGMRISTSIGDATLNHTVNHKQGLQMKRNAKKKKKKKKKRILHGTGTGISHCMHYVDCTVY
jgi:hypothetical protein